MTAKGTIEMLVEFTFLDFFFGLCLGMVRQNHE
jgi:hypothetical protein